MDLKTFMDENGLPASELAKLIGRDPSVVARYRARSVTPPLDVANQIVRITGGKVSHEDLVAAGSTSAASVGHGATS